MLYVACCFVCVVRCLVFVVCDGVLYIVCCLLCRASCFGVLFAFCRLLFVVLCDCVRCVLIGGCCLLFVCFLLCVGCYVLCDV